MLDRHLAAAAAEHGCRAATVLLGRIEAYILHHLCELTVAAWIKAQRPTHCRHDLADPGLCRLPVHAIAARWGFAQSADFSRAFRAAYGTTPTGFRSSAVGAAGALSANEQGAYGQRQKIVGYGRPAYGSAAPLPTTDGILRQGSKGTFVKVLQVPRLPAAGKLTVGGQFGPAACAAMQRALNGHGARLTVDGSEGQWGADTTRHLQTALDAGKFRPSGTPWGGYQGMRFLDRPMDCSWFSAGRSEATIYAGSPPPPPASSVLLAPPGAPNARPSAEPP
ncbi:helix-turn-helix domain-containing protein [Streptomyces sp. NPDC004237]|uniref:helix-turn-helix domain-containing protein n=1 Tax=Streptomyces sp. NPDC004237 TaxID=3154455 RepID=UPI00339F1272